MAKGARMGTGLKGSTGRRHRVAYNAHVQRDRLNKYYERKKAKAKYRRARRFEEKREPTSGGDGTRTLLDRVMADGLDAVTDDYERRLADSFGGSTESASSAQSVRPRGKKRRRISSVADATVDESGKATAETVGRDASETLGEERAATGGKRSRSKKNATPEAKREATAKEQPSKGSKRLPGKLGHTWETGRFSRDLKEFRKKQEAEAAERQRIQDEIHQRKRQRRETAKGRAIMGQLLAQRTARGQPKMQSMLEAVTAKLAGEQRTPKPRIAQVSPAAADDSTIASRGLRKKGPQFSRGW